MKWIHRLYIIFVGIILSLTVGFGISAFYPEPLKPQYPNRAYVSVPPNCYNTTIDTQSEDCKKLIREQKDYEANTTQDRQQYEKEMKVYTNTIGGYTRTAIFLGVAIGAIIAIIALLVIKISRLVANGLLLSGVLTALFTRLLVSLASLGAYTGTTENATNLGYMEFGVLVVLSALVITVGLNTLKEST